jgi:hypothetical protein
MAGAAWSVCRRRGARSGSGSPEGMMSRHATAAVLAVFLLGCASQPPKYLPPTMLLVSERSNKRQTRWRAGAPQPIWISRYMWGHALTRATAGSRSCAAGDRNRVRALSTRSGAGARWPNARSRGRPVCRSRPANLVETKSSSGASMLGRMHARFAAPGSPPAPGYPVWSYNVQCGGRGCRLRDARCRVEPGQSHYVGFCV